MKRLTVFTLMFIASVAWGADEYDKYRRNIAEMDEQRTVTYPTSIQMDVEYFNQGGYIKIINCGKIYYRVQITGVSGGYEIRLSSTALVGKSK